MCLYLIDLISDINIIIFFPIRKNMTEKYPSYLVILFILFVLQQKRAFDFLVEEK